jgi:ribulose-phosphate 3-epimerase
MKIFPSLLSCPLFKIPENIKIIEELGIETLHIDVMDGTYVPQLTYGTLFLQEIRNLTKLKLDVHLMISHPDRIYEDFITAGADTLTFHPETVEDPLSLLRSIQQKGCEGGIVINPHESVDAMKNLIEASQEIVVMTVNPGFAGQKMIPDSLDKCSHILDFCKDQKIPDPRIVCDGGIQQENFKQIQTKGFHGAIIGSALFQGNSLENTISDFLKITL